MATDTKDRRRSSIFGKIANALKGPQPDSTPAPSSDKKTEVKEPSKAAAAPAPASRVDTYGSSQQPLGKPYSVEGKTAIVTGAGSGINFCFAKLLISKGCNVLIADLALRPEAQELVDQHSEDGKPKASFVKTDVTNWSELSAMFETCYSTFGALDIVCPGAGVFESHWSNFWYPPGSTESKDPIDGGRYRMMDINVTHPIRTTQIAIAEFLKPAKGEKVSLENRKQIVHISSIAGQLFGLPTPMYIASKHAISGFVRSLGGLESTLGIKVTGVAPGVVKTPLFLDHPEKLKMIDQENDTWVTPEEVAEGMLKCVESADIAGGTILEVGSKYTRNVEPFNDPGPMGRPGMKSSNGSEKTKEVYEWLSQDGWGKTGLEK